MGMGITKNELLHYIAVYAVLLFAWVQAMELFGGDLNLVGVAVFLVFIAADKVAHRIWGL